jgi:hypothetical protein
VRAAAGDRRPVSKGVTVASVAVRSEASSFFFLQRDNVHKPMQISKTKMIAVSILGKNLFITKCFYSDFT